MDLQLLSVPSASSSASSAAWKKREQERQRRNNRGWLSPEQTNKIKQQAPTPGGRAPAAPISQHPQSRSDSDSGSLNGRFRGGITGATPTTTSPNRPQSNNDSNSNNTNYQNTDQNLKPPTSFGQQRGGTLGVLREDLERLNSYFEFHEQRQFSFQQRYGSVDLRALSRIDLHDVVEAVDVQVLQSIMTNATFSNVRERDLPLFSDHAMVKLIKVLQYSVEYLTNVQNTLLSNLDVYTDDNYALRQSLKEEQQANETTSQKYRSLRRFAKQQKRSLQLYEAMLVGGSAGTYEAAQAVAQQRILLKREARRATKHAARKKQKGRGNSTGTGNEYNNKRNNGRVSENENEENDDLWRENVIDQEQANGTSGKNSRSSTTRTTHRTTITAAVGNAPAAAAAAAATAATAATSTAAVSATNMSNVLNDIHRKHYQEQLDMVHAQLELAEQEAERQRVLAQDNLLETERQKSNALSTRMEALTRSHQIESKKAEQAMVALKHRRKQFRDHQLKRVLLRLQRKTTSYGFQIWKAHIQDVTYDKLRQERERAKQAAIDHQSKYDSLLARQKAAANRRRAARAKLMRRYANDEAQMNSIIRRYTHAKQHNKINRDHQHLMDQIETKAMLVVESGSTTAGILKTKAAQGMSNVVHQPIPKHPAVMSKWPHEIKEIRNQQARVESVVAEQLVSLFGFTRREQETRRLTFKRAVTFRHQLLAHHDELTHAQHDEMATVQETIRSVPKDEFFDDRFGAQFIHHRNESRKRHSLRIDRTATVSKLVDAMVPIEERYAKGERKRRQRRESEALLEQHRRRDNAMVRRRNGNGDSGSSSSSSKRPPSIGTNSPSSTSRPVVPSPRGMSPSGSRGRQMLKHGTTSEDTSISLRREPTTPKPMLPPRNRVTSEKRRVQLQQQEAKRRRQQNGQQNEIENKSQQQQQQQQQKPKKETKGDDKIQTIRNMSDEWDHFDSDDEPTPMEQVTPRNQRNRPITPPSDPDEIQEMTNEDNHTNTNSKAQENRSNTNKGPSVPTREAIRAMFVRSGMSDRTARLAVEKVFTFDDIEWSEEDLAQCVAQSRDTERGFFLRVLGLLEVPGIGNAHFQQALEVDKFWGGKFVLKLI